MAMFSLKQAARLAPRLSMRNIATSACLRVRKDENFTFDWDDVDQTPEKEREKFLKFKETFKLDDDPARRTTNSQRREYSVSQDPEEWRYVERLLEQSLPKTIPVPNVEPGTVKPSGFRMPTAKVGDHPYYVKRNPNWMLPVYVNQPWSLGQPQATITVIRRVEGNVNKLRDDLSNFLFQRYEQEFISQANEIMQKVVFRGNFDADFKEFLKDKGF